jgi:Raf kinase inhibitor-like YbhB/YbcL family protein
MRLISKSFAEGHPIPSEFAFAAIAPAAHITLSGNRNPHLAWDDVPKGTHSFVLICHDPDAPSRADDVNKEGREIPASLPRVKFFHWVLFDIQPAVREIAEGADSKGVTPHGKPGGLAADSFRRGINDYTSWFAGDSEMRGTYYGYDGPAPPWNDSVLHHYMFTIYALDVPYLDVKGELSGPNVVSALTGHVLGKATLTGTYSLNPHVTGIEEQIDHA